MRTTLSRARICSIVQRNGFNRKLVFDDPSQLWTSCHGPTNLYLTRLFTPPPDLTQLNFLYLTSTPVGPFQIDSSRFATALHASLRFPSTPLAPSQFGLTPHLILIQVITAHPDLTQLNSTFKVNMLGAL